MNKILIIGAGNMGGAIIDGLKNSSYDIQIYTHKQENVSKLKNRFNIDVIFNQQEIDIKDKIVLLCIKPQVFGSLRFVNQAKAIISIMAGVDIQTIKNSLKGDFYIRAMPNIAAKYKSSITAIVGDRAFYDETNNILKSIGNTVWLIAKSNWMLLLLLVEVLLLL